MQSDSHARSVSWFTIVGMLAAATHFITAVSLEHVGLPALWANPAGFLCAFPISYFGHHHWSFPGRHHRHRQALPRFLLIALTGFSANQLLLLTGLRLFAIPFWLLLGAVMGVVAVATYLLSRYWAFCAP